MSTNKFDWSVPQKASPIALIIIVGKIFKDSWLIILFFVVSYFFKNQEDTKAQVKVISSFMGVTIVLLVVEIRHLIGYFRFRFYLEERELIVLSGILSQTKTSIPINRIQSIHLVQTYLHRLTNTCQLKLETAGTENTELEIKAINKEKALALQAILQTATTHQEPLKSDVKFSKLHLKDVLKLAFSENHIKTFLIIVAFAFSRMEDLKQFLGINATDIIDEQVNQVQFTNSILLQLIIVVLFLTLIVSFVRVLLRYYGMQIKSTTKGFQMEWGFLQTQQKMLIQNKVQLISWNNNFIRKVLGIKIVRFFMTGEDILKTGQHIQLPIMQADLLYQLVSPYQAIWPSKKEQFNCVDKSYGWRDTVVFVLPITFIAAIAIYFWNPWYIFFPLIILIYFTISNWVKYQKFRFWRNNTSLQIQKGIWGEENILLNFYKIQQVSIKTSPFQRRKNLATIELYTAGETVIIPFIPIDQAQYMADWALCCIEFNQHQMEKFR